MSIGGLLRDFFQDTLSFDSRAWHTLGTLMRRPGRMTAEYIAGRRHSYTPPVRLYLLTSLLFLVIVTFPMLSDSLIVNVALDGSSALGGSAAPAPADTADRPASSPPTADPAADDGQCADLDVNLGLDMPALEQLVTERAERACRRLSQEGGGQAFTRELVDSLPTMLLILLPLMAFVLVLLYPFGGRRYVEHLVLLGHYHSFVFLLVGLTVALVRAPRVLPAEGWLKGVLIAFTSVYVPWYLYRAMRVVYGQGRVLTAVKFSFLVTAYVFGLSVALLVGVLLAAESFTR